MKTVLKMLAVAFLFVLSACTEEAEVLPVVEPAVGATPATPPVPVLVTYLTVVVEPSHNMQSNPSEDWIFIHTEDGQLYHHEQIVNGQTYTLQALDNVNLANMTVTGLRINDYSTQKSYNLTSYGKLQPGRTWTFKDRFVSTNLASLGQVDITVTDMPNWNSYTLSNIMKHSPSDLSAYKSWDPNFDPTVIEVKGFSYKETDDYLMTVIDANWMPSYKWINDLTNGADITLDGSTEFAAYDQIATIPLDNTINNFSFNVSGINATSGEEFGLYWTTTANPSYIAGSSASFGIGYLNDYQVYKTQMYIGNDNYAYSFSKKGSPVTTADVNFSEIPVTYNNTSSIATYDYNTATSHIMNSSMWIGGGGISDTYSINWFVFAPNSETAKILEMPVTDFPELDFANISFNSTTLVTQGDDYDTYTGFQFGDGTATSGPVQESTQIIP